MRGIITTLLEVVGLAAVTIGIAAELGAGWAAVVAGGSLVGLGYVNASGGDE